MHGENHPNWKGGRYQGTNGYIFLRVALGKYRLEHRVVLEAHLGRPLSKAEHVHHRNGNKTDNRPENLELVSPEGHTKHHWETGELRDVHIQRGMAECHPDRPHNAKGLCRQCYMNEAQKAYRERNPQAAAKRDADYRRRNREKINAYKRARRAAGLLA